jgi:LAGLIDADG-like domain
MYDIATISRTGNDRARLTPGTENKFLTEAIAQANGVDALARALNVSPRTVHDWRREKFLIPYWALMYIVNAYAIPLPHIVKHEKQFWYVTKGAREGGLRSYEKQGGKIGNPAIREQKWREWWKAKGQFEDNPLFRPLPFHKPRKSSALAEFMGIALGDGGMTNSQLTISLNHITDLAYSHFVAKLIKKLFHVTPAIYHIPKKSVNNIVISRSELMKHLHTLGLPFGNKVKQNFDIPDWIKRNDTYMLACIRGLVDTDGSVFTHHYRVNGKKYFYKKLSFCSSSPPLLHTVKIFLERRGFHVRIAEGVDIRIESRSGMEHYMKLIGSSNPKHLKRYKKR